MRLPAIALVLIAVFATGCLTAKDRRTLSSLDRVDPDLEDVRVDLGMEQALAGYRKFLEEAPESALTPDAMRRLADLQLEKEFGYMGPGEAAAPTPRTTTSRTAMAAPPPNAAPMQTIASDEPASFGPLTQGESEGDFEARAAATVELESDHGAVALPAGASGEVVDPTKGPREAIVLYDRILATYPDYPHNDEVLYQKARAYDELGEVDAAIAVIDELIARYPYSRAIDEAHFRRAEYFFTRKRFLDAEEGYQAVTAMGPASRYYEIALYKLGWTFYKQDLHEEAIDTYVALIDHKVATGYDFEDTHEETEERRVADTFRVISLSFSILGGAESIEAYFVAAGPRSYEDRIYSHLGEFYLDKLRYADAAGAYGHFVELHPYHRIAPRFSRRVVEIYETGGFGRLVLEAKEGFATRYALDSEYWVRHPIEDSPEVVDYLKANLDDLASHYHAMYQQAPAPEEKEEYYASALRWYRVHLASFPDSPGTPEINHRLADLHLEEEEFADAAAEYERTAYQYPAHERAAEAGYAAIYAHRQHEDAVAEELRPTATTMAVQSTLRFVEAFPTHEHAATVLGAAVDDLYVMKDLDGALAHGRRLIEQYPESDPTILRQAWTTVAHSLFDVERFAESEDAYESVLELTPADDEKRVALVDNLAAAIYKQGEQAQSVGDDRLAADHYLRVAEAAPSSSIRPAAEYDAGAALIRLEDWDAAASVLEAFREAHPNHELNREATRQIAAVYRSAGQPARAAAEFERVAAEADDDDLSRDALLTAAELYEEAELPRKAIAVHSGYVRAYPDPLEEQLESRFKIAELLVELGEKSAADDQLRRIVALDGSAGAARTDRVRNLAARSALKLTEARYHAFVAIELNQPFQVNLRKKQQAMKTAIDAFGELVSYEVGEVTAAATFYLAEIYFEFSRALLESERPTDLSETDLLDYEMVLEEEAYPFEERSIGVHEKNLELMSVGVYNRWIDKSLRRLGDTMPGRYAKYEEGSGPLTSIDRYAYVPPRPEIVLASTAGSDSAPGLEPAAAPEVEVEVEVEVEAEVTTEPAPAPEPMPADLDEAATEPMPAKLDEAATEGEPTGPPEAESEPADVSPEEPTPERETGTEAESAVDHESNQTARVEEHLENETVQAEVGAG